MKKRIILFLTGYFSLHAILIPKEILDHYKLTKSIIWSQIQRELFGDCYGIEYYEYGDQKLLFVADPKWHRIVYADLRNLENPNEPHMSLCQRSAP